MLFSDRLIQAADDYADGKTTWDVFHAVLETDFYRNSCGGACKPCSREWVAKQAGKMKRQKAQYS